MIFSRLYRDAKRSGDTGDSLKAATLGALILFACCSFSMAMSEVTVYFSPTGGCTKAICVEIGKATNSIDVMAYYFSSHPIVSALTNAVAHKVKVALILDGSQATNKAAVILRGLGVPVWVDYRHNIMHTKGMIIDGKTVLEGSFNFTATAEYQNAEWLFVIHNVKVAQECEANWKLHAGHSQPY